MRIIAGNPDNKALVAAVNHFNLAQQYPGIQTLAEQRRRPIADKAKPFLRTDSLSLSQTEFSEDFSEFCWTQSEDASKLKAVVLKERGDRFLKSGQLDAARDTYNASMRLALGKDLSYDLPHSSAFIEGMRSLELEQLIDLVACANGIAECYIKERDDIHALDWLDEVHCLFDSYAVGQTPNCYPWKILNLPFKESITECLKTYKAQATIWESLGNSSAAHDITWNAIHYGLSILPPKEDLPQDLKSLSDRLNSECTKYSQWRHPDPATIGKLQLNSPDLQVRGVWKKLNVGVGKHGVPITRLGFASAIWRGTLYVFGGEHATHKTLKDGWALKLNDLEAGWRKVPFPNSVQSMTRTHIALHEDKGYVFSGQPILQVFDFKTETWSTVRTSPKGNVAWQTIFPSNKCERHSVQIQDAKIYIFGGKDTQNIIGRNVLAMLDLATRKWEILSGRPALNADTGIPGVREYPASWVHDDRLYITLGDASRSAAYIGGKPEGSPHDLPYPDLWSYNLAIDTWRKEKMSGNVPAARSETGCVFNTKWNRAIVFGGYSGSLESNPDNRQDRVFDFTYFADTYIWNPETKKWAFIISRGFPTYRAQSSLLVDEGSGRTFMFGGYTNTMYTPSTRKSFAQSFNDVWELHLDVPGCTTFSSTDFEVDPRLSKLGPWKTCFNCKSVGRWSVCAGSCRGTDEEAAFCGKDCQKAGWSEHKKLNGCRNISK